MALLTWRNVDAPNFSSSNDAARMAADLMNRAGNGAIASVDAFDNAIKDKQNSYALSNVLQYQDANELKQALADSRAFGGVDATRLTADTMRTGADRVGSLMNQAATQQAMDHNTEVYSDWKDKLEQGKAPEISAYLAASASGNPEQMAAARATLMDKGLRSDVVAPYIRDGATIRGLDLNNQMAAGDLIAKAKERSDAHTAMAAAQDVLKSGIGGDAIGLLHTKYAHLSPEAFDLATRFVENRTNIDLADMAKQGVDSSSATPPGVSAFDRLYGDDKYYKKSQPLIGMTLAQLAGETRHLYNATAGKIGQGNLGTTAAGAWQLTQTAINDVAPSVLGKNWKNAKFTPDVQEQLAKAYFDKYKNGDLVAKWPSLARFAGASKPGAFKDKNFDDFKYELALGEGGYIGGASQARSGASQAAIQIQQTLGRLNGDGGISEAVLQHADDHRDLNTVADEVVSKNKNGGMDKYDVIKAIEIIKSMPGAENLTYAAAGHAILQNATSSSDWWTKVKDGILSDPNTNGFRLGQAKLQELAAKLDPNNVAATAYTLNSTRAAQAMLQARLDALNKANARLQELYYLKTRGGRPDIDTSKAEMAVGASQLALTQYLDHVNARLNKEKQSAPNKASDLTPLKVTGSPTSIWGRSPDPVKQNVNKYDPSSW